MTRIYALIAGIVALVLAIVLIIGALIVSQISDDTDNTDSLIAEQDVSLTDAIHHHIVSALDGAEGGEIELHLDGYDVNEFLYALARKIGGIDVRSLYIEEADGIYSLCAPVTLIGMDSLISGELSLYKEGDTIFARVSGLSVGRVGINSALVSLLGVKNKITRLLNDNGIPAYFVDDVLTIQLSESDIGNIIATALKDNPNVGLVNALYSLLMISENAVDIEISSPTDIKVNVDMTIFDGRPTPSLDGVNDYSEALLSEGVVDRSDIGVMAKYYLNGYDRLTDEEKTTVSERLASESTPEEISAYGGIVEREKISLLNILLTQLELNTDYLLPGFKIADDDISAMLSDLPLVGMVWQYASYRDGSCAYIAVQSLYCVLGDELIEMYIDLNVNGYLLTVRADFISGESPVTAIGGRLDGAYLGEAALNAYETDQLFDFLSIKMQYKWIFADPEMQTLTIDFTSAFEESNLLITLLKNSKRIVTVCKSSQLSNGGYVQITINLF